MLSEYRQIRESKMQEIQAASQQGEGENADNQYMESTKTTMKSSLSFCVFLLDKNNNLMTIP